MGTRRFDYRTIDEPEISVKDLESRNTKVIIAAPAGNIPFNGRTLSVCFMEIDIHKMLDGLSLQTDANSFTFCNLYYQNGLSLTDVVLGGQAEDPNLLTALREAEFSAGSSLEQMSVDFAARREGGVSFTFRGGRKPPQTAGTVRTAGASKATSRTGTPETPVGRHDYRDGLRLPQRLLC